MQKLNLPDYSYLINFDEQKRLIFDKLRKKYVMLTPEEWVRQNFIEYLINARNFPKGLMAVEMNLVLNNMSKRCDIVVYNRNGKAVFIVECKAPGVEISQKVFDQISIYNISLRVEYLIVTNGMTHYCCMFDKQQLTYTFLPEIPDYNEIGVWSD